MDKLIWWDQVNILKIELDRYNHGEALPPEQIFKLIIMIFEFHSIKWAEAVPLNPKNLANMDGTASL